MIFMCNCAKYHEREERVQLQYCPNAINSILYKKFLLQKII